MAATLGRPGAGGKAQAGEPGRTTGLANVGQDRLRDNPRKIKARYDPAEEEGDFGGEVGSELLRASRRV